MTAQFEKRMFGTLHRRWVELWPWASFTWLQTPSFSLFYQRVFFSKKMRVQIVETMPTDFHLLWSHIRNRRWWSSLRIAVVNFILAHLQLCHRQSNHKLVVFPAGCKKGYSFCTHIGVAFSVPLVATSSFVEKLKKPSWHAHKSARWFWTLECDHVCWGLNSHVSM